MKHSTTKSRGWGSSIRAWACALNDRRERNSNRFVMTNRLFLLLYPIFIVCMAELNQCKYLSKLVIFIAQHPTIMLFNVLIAALIFAGFLLLFRRGWFAMLVQTIIYMALSITELFKYNTNGNHLIMNDMKLARSLKSLTAFAYIKITPRLITFLAICVAVLVLAFLLNPQIKHTIRLRTRILPGIVCLGFCIGMVVMPSWSMSVYSLFQIDTKRANNTFILNEKFDHNGFLAFFMQTGSENIANRLEEPTDYEEDSENTVDMYLATNVPEEDFGTVKPNVIEIMSESYADFRVFDELKVDDSYYAGLDEVAAKGYCGTAIVPTYASYTVRTETELLFGLPVKSLRDPNMPQRLMLDRQQPTMASYYKSWGYHTAYVHPYLSSFYGRKSIYGNYSFDTMIFEDDFTVPVEYYGNYIDDNTVYNQIYTLLEQTDEPLYLHATTMQNHQPYDQGENPDAEFENYLQWVQHSSEGLADLIDRLQDFDEPTVVLFIGDHFPSLRGESSVYNLLGITSENCSTLYEQKYILWNNCGLDTDVIPKEKFSSFYLPYVIMEMIHAPRDAFLQTMMDEIAVTPIYSTNYNPEQEDVAKLDVLTYDRILGDIVSPSPLEELADTKKDTN